LKKGFPERTPVLLARASKTESLIQQFQQKRIREYEGENQVGPDLRLYGYGAYFTQQLRKAEKRNKFLAKAQEVVDKKIFRVTQE
jgi:hypothetical protein